MRKVYMMILMIGVLFLSGCSDESDVSNFSKRKDGYLINQDKTVIVEYKTDENGDLVQILFDRLLTIEDMIYLNSTIDYNMDVEGYTGDVFTDAGVLCTSYIGLKVPVGIEIGNVRYKYDYVDCGYIEVDRDNEEKSGSFVSKFDLDDTIDISRDTIVSIVVFDPSSLERFIEVQYLPHTVKMLGVYSVELNRTKTLIKMSDLNSDGSVKNYFNDIGVFEQLLLKHQEGELAIDEIKGFSENVNLFDFEQAMDNVPLVEDFETRYEDEIDSFEEVFELIGIVNEVTDDSEEPSEDN